LPFFPLHPPPLPPNRLTRHYTFPMRPREIRVAVFTETYPPALNGVAISVHTFCRELRALGHKVLVFAPSFPGRAAQEEEGVFRFPAFLPPQAKFYPIPIPLRGGFWGRIKRFRPDVVHLHSIFVLSTLGLLCGRKLGVPIVLTYHTLLEDYAHYGRPIPEPLVRWFLRERTRRFCNLCDLVISPGRSIIPLLRSYGVRRPILALPTGVEAKPPPLTKQEARRALGLPDGILVLYVGRVGKEKNIPLLLRSFSEVAPKVPRARLVVVGGGPLLKEAKRMAAKLGIERRALFVGFVPRDRVPLYYRACDVFAFPSTTETQGLSVLEALAHGLPAVTVNVNGAGELVTHGADGFVVPPELGPFSSALLSLLRDEALRRRMGEAARKKGEEFSSRRQAQRLVEIYLSLLKQKNRA